VPASPPGKTEQNQVSGLAATMTVIAMGFGYAIAII
jgi:hypothetical protein